MRAARTGVQSSRRGDPRATIGLVAVLAYVFYFVGQYIVLYLSRVREYAADGFSAQYTDGDHLSSALIKIAYGILVSEENAELARLTKHIGLMSLDQSRDKGAFYYS